MESPGEKVANSALLLGISLVLNLGLFGFLCAQAAYVGRLAAQTEKLLAADARLAGFAARIDSLSAQYQAFAKVFARSTARTAPYMPALDMLLYEQGAWFVQMTLERALKKMLNVYHTRSEARRRISSEDDSDDSEGGRTSASEDAGGAARKTKHETSGSDSGGSGSGSDSDEGPDTAHSSEDDKHLPLRVAPLGL